MASAKPARVLVIEDDPDIADVIAEALLPAGVGILTARTGRGGIERAAEADLVILDIGLPDLDGIAVCETLRATPGLERLAIIMLTGLGATADRVRGIRSGADDYLAKPFAIDELLVRVESLLRSRQIESALRDRTRQLDTLRTLLGTLVSTVAIDDLAQRIVDAVPDAFGRDSAMLGGMIATVDARRHVIRAHAITDNNIARRALPLLGRPLREFEAVYDPPRNLTEEAALTGESRSGNSLAQFVSPTVPRPIAWAIERVVGLRGMVAHPARAQGHVTGICLFAWSKPVEEITPTEHELMREFADTAGIGLENVRLYRVAEDLALTDGLTGVANRRHFDAALVEELARVLRLGYPLGLLVLDVDHFKAYNDRFGHQAGDQALQIVAHIIGRSVRATDLVARYGGEEFAVLLPGSDLAGAHTLAEKIRRAVAAEAPDGLTISIGATSTREVDPAKLVAAADAALYEAKRAGRNRTTVAA